MKADIKDKILSVSEKLFNRFGINKTGVDEIAEEAEVAKGTIYNYFGNKEGVIKAIIEEKKASFSSFIDKYFNYENDPFTLLKKAIVEKVKIRMETPFLSDKMIAKKKNIEKFLIDLDISAQNIFEKILTSQISKKISSIDVNKDKILETLSLLLKGLDEKIKEGYEKFSLEKIEEFIDYIIKTIFHEYKFAK